jgi:hypothetical protein
MKRRRRYGEIRVLGGIPSAFKLEPAPRIVGAYLRSSGLLAGLKVKGQKAVCNFYFFITAQLLYAEMLDVGSGGCMNWGPPSPALRQKLHWMAKRLAKLTDAARSERLRGTDLLVQAQENLAEFQKQLARKKVRRLTGKIYLNQAGWMTRPPAVAFALFHLLRRHSTPSLTKREICERISHVHSELLGLNLEADSILKQIDRFPGDTSFRKLPNWRRQGREDCNLRP